MRFSAKEYLELGQVLSTNYFGLLALRNSLEGVLCSYYTSQDYWNCVPDWYNNLAVAQSALDAWEDPVVFI